MSGHYDIAQICRNGHVINTDYCDNPARNQPFCDKCGQPTITVCKECNASIRGNYKDPGLIAVYKNFTAPSFCHNCGKPYPWTVTKLEGARELVDEFDELNDSEKVNLKNSLDDLVRDSPKTELAGKRFKDIMKKLGKNSYEIMKSLVTDIVSETVKKMLFGGN